MFCLLSCFAGRGKHQPTVTYEPDTSQINEFKMGLSTTGSAPNARIFSANQKGNLQIEFFVRIQMTEGKPFSTQAGWPTFALLFRGEY